MPTDSILLIGARQFTKKSLREGVPLTEMMAASREGKGVVIQFLPEVSQDARREEANYRTHFSKESGQQKVMDTIIYSAFYGLI